MKSLLLCILLLTATSVWSVGQEPRVNPKQIELGDVTKPRDVEFFMHNDSETSVVITKVESSCGCTKLKYSRAPIAKGDSTKFSLRYIPNRDEEGLFYKTVKIYTSATAEPITVVVRGTNKQ